MTANTTLLPLSQKSCRHLKSPKSKTLGFSSFYLVVLCLGPCLNVSRSLGAPLKSPLLVEAFLVHPVPNVHSSIPTSLHPLVLVYLLGRTITVWICLSCFLVYIPQ